MHLRFVSSRVPLFVFLALHVPLYFGSVDTLLYEYVSTVIAYINKSRRAIAAPRPDVREVADRVRRACVCDVQRRNISLAQARP